VRDILRFNKNPDLLAGKRLVRHHPSPLASDSFSYRTN
jgi:hypothetical protein